MADVKWIKIVTDIFDDEKMLLIESLPSADSIIVIWFKLLCLAGKNNNNGVFIMSDKIAYTDEMLATIFRRDVNTVRLALKTFESYGMIEIIDGIITIPNWGKHQNLDKIEQKNTYMKEYMRDYRKKQKEKIESNELPDCSCKTNVSVLRKSNVSEAEEDIDKEKDKDKEKEREIDITIVSKDTIRQTQSVKNVIKKWNELSTFGIPSVERISLSSKRGKSLKARLMQYGEEKVIQAIEYIKTSDYLQGKNKYGWSITFDWFVGPDNFQKVLERNYDNKAGKNNYHNKTAEMLNQHYEMADEWAREMEAEGNDS